SRSAAAGAITSDGRSQKKSGAPEYELQGAFIATHDPSRISVLADDELQFQLRRFPDVHAHDAAVTYHRHKDGRELGLGSVALLGNLPGRRRAEETTHHDVESRCRPEGVQRRREWWPDLLPVR